MTTVPCGATQHAETVHNPLDFSAHGIPCLQRGRNDLNNRYAQKIEMDRSPENALRHFHGFGCRQNGGVTADPIDLTPLTL